MAASVTDMTKSNHRSRGANQVIRPLRSNSSAASSSPDQVFLVAKKALNSTINLGITVDSSRCLRC